MRLFRENPRVYATVNANPAYRKKREKNRENRQAKTKFNSSESYWENIPQDPTQK